MVCKHCGNLLREDAVVCDQCGAEIRVQHAASGASGRRQGKAETAQPERVGSMAVPEAQPYVSDAVMESRRRPRSEGASRTDNRRGTPPPPTDGSHMGRVKREQTRPVRRMMINWAMVWTIVLALCFVGAIGGYVFLKKTDAGQLILARMGKEANAQALWTYGQELLDQGYVEKAIQTYEAAYELEPDREDIYSRLEQMADAYEAGGYAAKAEQTYIKMYSEVDKENVFAYQAIVRMLQDQDRRMELSSFLQLAYENTGDSSFRRQREDLIPSTPTTDKEAGSLMLEQDIQLISAEDYDIYYVFGEEGQLPEDGTLYTGKIHLTEGTHILRAVAVSNDLVSDELSVKYTINLPVPTAPYASLASGEYKQRQRIWLRYQESEGTPDYGDQESKDITIYYTLDGQTPTSNSPIYTGEPFYLPDGKVTVKAVAVNGYGKVSNVMERTYKIGTLSKTYFGSNDTFSEFTLLKTTREAFEKKFGAPQSEQAITEETMPGSCVQCSYSWGQARFVMSESGYVLYFFETNNSSITAPRKLKIGASAEDITGKYRDVGQTYDQNGDRSLYYDDQNGTMGKLYALDGNATRIDYRYTRKEDSAKVILSFYLQNDKTVKIGIRAEY